MKTERFEYLDSVRGIACMIVVLVHVMHFIYPQIHTGNYSGKSIDYSFFNTQIGILFFNGSTAVAIFFILSGFVLSYRFMGTYEPIKIIESIIKRPIRLSGVVLFTMLPLFSYVLTCEFWTTKIWIDYDIYINATWSIISNLLSGIAYCNNPPLWTINTELWGSWLVFVICMLIGYLNKYKRIIILFILLGIFIKTYYSAFIIGMIVSDLYKNWSLYFITKNRNIISFIILLNALGFGKYITEITTIDSTYGMFNAVSLFLFIMFNTKIQGILRSNILTFIGGISFSIYVLHWIILFPYSKQLYNYLYSISDNCYISFFVSFILLSSLIIFVAYFADRIIDKPCTKFSSWFAKNLIANFYFCYCGNSGKR